MLDAIATNHTAFFREPQHFEFLAKVVLPSLRAREETTPILGWSAACSSGEEPYTIAMTAYEVFGGDSGRPLRLLASDLSTKALTRAVAGIYKADRRRRSAPSSRPEVFREGRGSAGRHRSNCGTHPPRRGVPPAESARGAAAGAAARLHLLPQRADLLRSVDPAGRRRSGSRNASRRAATCSPLTPRA